MATARRRTARASRPGSWGRGLGGLTVPAVLTVLTVLTVVAVPGTATAHEDPHVRNGGFETGTLAGWRTAELGNEGDGWSAAMGRVSPVSGFRIPAPPQGRWQAVVDQTGPGSHLLFQSFEVDDDESGLRLTLWYRNRNNRFFTPRTLDPFSRPNQQLRVDLMRPGAPARSMAAGDILATVFRTKVGDPLQMAPRVLRWDLSRFEDRTIRLRIAEVDNQFFFQAGVDAVRVVEMDDAHWPDSNRGDLTEGQTDGATDAPSGGTRAGATYAR